MRRRAVGGPVIARLAALPARTLADAATGQATSGNSACPLSASPVRIATDGALWGSITGHGCVIVSDDAASSQGRYRHRHRQENRLT